MNYPLENFCIGTVALVIAMLPGLPWWLVTLSVVVAVVNLLVVACALMRH